MTAYPAAANRSCLKHILIAAIGYFVLAWGGIALTRESDGISSVWLATGFAIALLLRSSKKEWPMLVLAMLIGNMAAHYAHGDSLSRTLATSPISVIQSYVTAYAIHRYTKGRFDLSRYSHLIFFSFCAFIGSLPFALIAASYFFLEYNKPFASIAAGWYFAAALGVLIFTPVFYVIDKAELKSLAAKNLRGRSFLLFIGLVASLAVIFLQTTYPILFPIFPVMALSAFLLGVPGAVAALGITTVVSITCTLNGMGPIGLIDESRAVQTLVLQGFLATAGFISLPIASALSYRTRLETSLTEAKLAADKANIAKSRFLTSMSHELRTPLNAILGFSQLMLMNQDKTLTDKNREHLDYILSSGRHLMELVDDILDLAKIESGNLSVSFEPISCAEIVEETAEMLRSAAAKKNIKIEYEIDPSLSILADRGRLMQILVNLLSNAVKYNKDSSSVKIKAERRDGMIRLTVCDKGRGIPYAQQKNIFQPFNRLGAEMSDIEGTGIGLAISKQLAEAMHGSLGFYSEENVGSDFYVELSESPEKAELFEQDSVSIEPSNRSASKILYIEDNAANADLMKNIVRDFINAEIIVVKAGQDGIKKALDYNPDLIISDIHLPDMSGNEILYFLRANPLTENIPVFALTSDGTFPQHEDAKGFDRVLTKPFRLKEMVEEIDAVLRAA